MANKYRLQRLFRDSRTRIVIPDLSITATAAIINIVSSYVTNPTKTDKNFFSLDAVKSNFNNRLGNEFDLKDEGIMGLVTNIINLLVIGFGVTKLETQQEYVMPFSKGIGSTGEVIYSYFINNPTVYPTTVGLYNDQNNLLAVAKLSKPIQKDFTKEALIRVKLDF